MLLPSLSSFHTTSVSPSDNVLSNLFRPGLSAVFPLICLQKLAHILSVPVHHAAAPCFAHLLIRAHSRLTFIFPYAKAQIMPARRENSIFLNVGLGTAAKRAVGGGANQIPDMGFFQAIIATGNTLLKFPFIDQYGNARTIMVQLVTIQTTGGADKGYPLPYAFPNAGLFATGNRATSGYNAAMNVRIANATTVSIQNWANAGALEDCCVIAVGW